MAASIYDFSCITIAGEERPLDEFRGKILLIVNIATRCGFTPQLSGLENIHRNYQGRGVAVLGFPCNQFGKQAPGSDGEILEFCRQNYAVSFPLFAKVEVDGSGAHPLYQYLKNEARGALGSQRIKWNFTKFLVDTSGQVVGRFGPTATPAQIESELQALLS